MKGFRKLKALVFLPIRFPVLFILCLLLLLSSDPITYIGLVLWPYSFCLFWHENEFYRVASKRKYKYSFVHFLVKLKKYAITKGRYQEKLYQFMISVLPFIIISLILGEKVLIIPLVVGYGAFQVDYFIQKKWLW